MPYQRATATTPKDKKRISDRAVITGNYNINYSSYEIHIPNYQFGKPVTLTGAGGLIAACIGKRISDDQIVLAKLSPHSVRLEREYHITKRLYALPEGPRYVPHAIDFISLVQDGLSALIYVDIEPMDFLYFECDNKAGYYSIAKLPFHEPLWDQNPTVFSQESLVDLPTFLSFAIETCSALQFLHENGVIHGELRPTAFQCVSHRDPNHFPIISSKIWNFGGGSKSYEEFLLKSSRWKAFMNTDDEPAIKQNDFLAQNKLSNRVSNDFCSTREFQTSLIYVSPEQTGRTANMIDHRADLYSLGIMFYVILTNCAPFNGSAVDIIHAILSKNVPLVHSIRKDIPPVISLIIDKLTRKTVDERYDSAYGLREDLLECQKRLSTQGTEALVFFPLGQRDINPIFKVADGVYGRSKEIEILKTIINRTSQSHKAGFEKMKNQAANPPESDNAALNEADMLLRRGNTTSSVNDECEIVVLQGPGGIGKSTLISTIHVHARQYGYTAVAKFDKNQKQPYNGLLRCLSAILRQLLTESETVIKEFYDVLKRDLGPQFANLRLMVNMVPELKPILYGERDIVQEEEDFISNSETRFHSIFLNIIKTITRNKMITLCLDDLQEADEPSIYLIGALLASHTKLLVILTFRDGDEKPETLLKVLENFTTTTIQLRPLRLEALSELVKETVRQSNGNDDTLEPLVDTLYTWTRGNPFYAKQFLKIMKRNEDIWFDWNERNWKFRLDNISILFDTSRKKKKKSQESNNVFDVRHLVSHLKALDRDAQVFLMWASLMGHSFNFSQIKRLIMSNEMTDIVLASSSGGESVVSGNSDVIVTKPDDEIDSQLTQNLISSVEQEEQQTTRAMGGLQIALNEGVIHYKTGNVFAFIHDRYYQAASMLIDDKDKEKMHSIIANMLMSESIDEEYHDVFLTADHIIQSVEIIRQLDTEKARYRETLIKAGNEASVSGALAIAINYYECALSLLPESERWTDGVESSFEETLLIYMKLLELNWAHNEDSTDDKTRMTLDQILEHTESRPYERAQAWRIQAKIYFQQAKYQQGIEIILKGLNELGTIQGLALNIKDDEMFDLYYQVKESITQKGFEHLSEVGPCKDKKLLAIMSLLNEGCTGAYWINPTLVDFFALKLCELSLCSGYGASSGGGFIWTGFTATRVSDFNFAAELGKFGMVIAEKYAGNSEIAKAISVNYAMLAQWTGVHVREYIYQYQRAYKYAIAGGDKLSASMALFYVSTTLYWTSGNLSEIHWHLSHSMEECRKSKSKDVIMLNICLQRSVMVFQGKTDTIDPAKMMNDEDLSTFDESLFVENLKSQSVHSGNPLNWYYSFKMILLFHFGFYNEASELGFKVFDSPVNEAVHRHVGIAMYYHCIAIVESLKNENLDPHVEEKYRNQLFKCEKRLGQLANHSEVNYRMYHRMVQTQISTLEGDMNKSIRLYNEVLETALRGNWFSFLGLTYELTAAYYFGENLDMLGIPMLMRSLEFYGRWGAHGKVLYLTKKYSSKLNSQTERGIKKEMAVQTEDTQFSTAIDTHLWDDTTSDESPDSSLRDVHFIQDEASGERNDVESSNAETTLLSLDIVDLTSIIKSSQVISNEMNSFDELLKKMIAIIMSNSGAESGAIIIKEGHFGIAAYSTRSNTCETYEPPIPLNDDNEQVSSLIVHYVIHTHAMLFIPNVEEDARFATGSQGSHLISVICMPIMHKNTLVGVLYLQANLNTFTYKHANVLALLCDQIGISITNALLFKSVQKATKANARMIESQLQALEEARASREQALRATKMKSNFLANMSHELRTPFSGFYGMISLLSETRLDNEQREFVSIAKQSCEMLLHIIDDLLDFSKLEANKVKLHYGLFYIEDLIADRIELLITLATNKNVELSYFIAPNIPRILFSDGNRIGQILMNLIGNAIKFTHQGEVVVRCEVKENVSDLEKDDVVLNISVQDTGIGMSQEEIKSLFLPFSQVDGSTTRNFGGTGLGLSICLQLVRLLKGNISVESTVGKGSKFTFDIRVKNGSSVAEPGIDFDPRDSTMNELSLTLGQPRILMACNERMQSMIASLLPDLKYLENEKSTDEAIQYAISRAKESKAFDCLILDSPLPDVVRRVVDIIEETPALKCLKIILLVAPTMENIRRHLSSSSITINDMTQYHIFHPRVTRLSKPIRRLKLLNAFLKSLERDRPSIKPLAIDDEKSSDDKTGASTTNLLVGRPTATRSLDEKRSKSEPMRVSSYASQSQGFSSEELAIFQGQKILVAEDNPIAQRLIVKQLERLGFKVVTCNNGFECFDTWKARGPGHFLLAWIDHHMPGCDGLEATRKIRKYEAEQKYTPLPIIALTADIQATAQKNCMEAGMDDYITKPLMQKDLVTILRRYCLISNII